MREITFPSFYGNEAALDALRSGIAMGKVAHAYLLEGPRGSGKYTLAQLTAAAICCTDSERAPCRRCRACKTILATPIQSPDVRTLGREENEARATTTEDEREDTKQSSKKKAKKSIGVEAVRMLKDDAYMLPTELEKKIYIIAGAERMTVQAQNALLKILEEPPASVVFFLLCESRNALLPTIRSRVQSLRMETFDDETLSALLRGHDARASDIALRDEARFALAIRLSRGTYGGALSYLTQPKQSLSADPVYHAHITAQACLSVIFSDPYASSASPILGSDLPAGLQPTKASLGQYLSERVDTRERMAALLSALAAALRDITVCMRATEEMNVTLLFFTHAEQPRALSERISSIALHRVGDTVASLLDTVEANPNITLVRDLLADALFGLRLGL